MVRALAIMMRTGRPRLVLVHGANAVTLALTIRSVRFGDDLVLVCSAHGECFADSVVVRTCRLRLPVNFVITLRVGSATAIARRCWRDFLPLNARAADCCRPANTVRGRRGCPHLVLCPRDTNAVRGAVTICRLARPCAFPLCRKTLAQRRAYAVVVRARVH